MANGSRRVVVDDTHSSIVYSTNPPWILDDTGVMDNVGNFGKTLNTTLHGTNSNGNFSFSFSGTAIDIYGTNDIRNSSGIIDPLWSCYLNGVQIISTPPFQFEENNWHMCGIDDLLDMNHTFTLSVSTFGQTFWFDYLVYTPSPNATLQNDSVVLVPFSDAALVYDASWQPWSNLSIITRTLNAVVEFQFLGTSISWYGIYPKELPIQPALATFSIDSGKETTFRLQGLSANAPTAYNQLLFNTDVYVYGLHTLIVNFEGDNDTTPLSLDYILIQTGDKPSGAATTPPPPVTVVGGNAGRPSILIVGLVCGVMAFVLTSVLLVYFLIIKRRKDAKNISSAFPASIRNPVLTVPTARHSMATAPHLDLASSSPYLGVGTTALDHNRCSTWRERLRALFSAAFNRTPRLGMVVNSPTTDHPRQHFPQILSLWARRNLSSQSHQSVNVVHRPQMPIYHHQGQVAEYLTSGGPEARDTGGTSGGNMPTSSLSLPSASGRGFSTSSADASYYGGYRTKREIIELEKRHQR